MILSTLVPLCSAPYVRNSALLLLSSVGKILHTYGQCTVFCQGSCNVLSGTVQHLFAAFIFFDYMAIHSDL
jgi:hypothetical protein